MIEFILFLATSLIITWISLPSLRKTGSHGYFRFFAWEGILGLFFINLHGWFNNPFSWHQMVSWFLLILSLIPLIAGVYELKKSGKPSDALEATTHLVDKGIYRYIRHPLYASLLFLAWGIFFKSPSILDGCVVLITTAFLYTTARADENECLCKFGEPYQTYMTKTRLFIPFIF